MKIITLLCAAALAVCAQTTDSVTVHFSTPVVVGETLIPAGECNIQILRGSSDNVTLTVRSASGAVASILVNRIYDETTGSIYNPHVVLRRSGNAFHFERLMLGDRTGFEIQGAGE